MPYISTNEARMAYGRPTSIVRQTEWEDIPQANKQEVSPNIEVANKEFHEGYSYAPKSDLRDALAKALEDTKNMFGKELR